MALAVRMLAPNLPARHAVHDEEPFDLEREELADLAGDEIPAEVGNLGERMDNDALHARLARGERGGAQCGCIAGSTARGTRIAVAHDACRIAGDDRIRGHRLHDDCPGADHCAASDRDARQDRRVCADGCAFLDRCRKKRLWFALAARKAIVGERRVRSDKDVVLDTNAVPELHAALHGDAIADHHVVFDERVIADVAIGADARTRQDMRKCPDARTGPHFPCFAHRLRVHEFFHGYRSSPNV